MVLSYASNRSCWFSGCSRPSTGGSCTRAFGTTHHMPPDAGLGDSRLPSCLCV